jgi:hypothetical protein
MQWRFFVLTILWCYSLPTLAQPVPYSKDYFRNPLGLPMDLSANFGELRPNHWHMGLDLRTNAKENAPVYAAAEGYIAHIGVRPQSFGRFIIINHPNGLSTLYGHLNDFFPSLEEYVIAKQYENESWAIELDLTSDQFPVTKGSFFAYSGNTGGSQGPHLHFEIFDTKTEKRLNPLLFDFPIRDNVPPNLVKLAMYDRSKTVYEQTPKYFSLKSTDKGYIIPKLPVIRTGLNKVSFAIQAYDRMSGSNNPNGIYAATLNVDEVPQVSFAIDSIDYNESLYMNAHIDYKSRYNGGSFVQHLSRMPGDNGPVYKKKGGDGVLHLADTSRRQVSIEVMDAAGNSSLLHFFIQYDASLRTEDTRQTAADVFTPGKVNALEKPGFDLYLSEKSLYDTVSPAYYVTASVSPYSYSDLHHAGDPSVPLHEDAIIRIKLKKPVPEEWQDKLLIQRTDRKGSNFRKAIWQEQWLSAKFGDFGTYQILADISPPRVNDPGKGDTINLSAASRIIFTPADNFGIRKFRAELDNQWIRFTNDKGRNWIYKFDERCPYGVHHLKVTVEDYAGNITVKEWWFKRYPYTPPPKKKTVKKKSTKKK